MFSPLCHGVDLLAICFAEYYGEDVRGKESETLCRHVLLFMIMHT